jgi:prepilin-type processing-associated H-X9-DG protein
MQNRQTSLQGAGVEQYTLPYVFPSSSTPVSFNRMLRFSQFKNPTEKIWYADGARKWDQSRLIQVESVGWMSSRGLKDGLITGNFGGQVSWRHGTDANPRGNVVYFDGHAVSIDPREVTPIAAMYSAPTPEDIRKYAKYWDPDGDGDYLTPSH